MTNKRGLSEVISNILIVLVTVAAVAILVPFLTSFVRDNLSDATSCDIASNSFIFDRSLNYNCMNQISSSSYNVYPSIKVLNDDEKYNETYSALNGFSLSVFYTDGSVDSFYVPGNTSVKMLPNNAVSSIPPVGGSRTYNISVSKSVDKIEINPVLTSGKVCSKTDSLEELKICN